MSRYFLSEIQGKYTKLAKTIKISISFNQLVFPVKFNRLVNLDIISTLLLIKTNMFMFWIIFYLEVSVYLTFRLGIVRENCSQQVKHERQSKLQLTYPERCSSLSSIIHNISAMCMICGCYVKLTGKAHTSQKQGSVSETNQNFGKLAKRL